MLQRIRVAALAVIVGAGVLVGIAPSAATATPPAPDIARVSISPAPPVDVTSGPVTVTFSFLTKNATTAELQLTAPGEVSVPTPVALTKGKTVRGWTKWTGTREFTSANTGTWTWRIIATGAGGTDTKTGTFTVVVKVATSIADFDARPDLVKKGDKIKVSGRLLAAGEGLAGQTVSITFRARGADAYTSVATVTTGRGGWFAAKVQVNATGYWRAEFAATATHQASVSDADRVDVKRRNLGSKIVGFDARPEPVNKGDKLRFSGALQVERRGGVAGARVGIFFKAHGSTTWESVTTATTGRHGRFWASATAVASGWWRAQYAGAPGVNGTASAPDWVTVKQPAPPPAEEKADTRLIKFNAFPEPIKRGKHLKFWGKLQVDDMGTWEGYAAEVGLFFKPLGSKKWIFVKAFDSSDSGVLFAKVKALKSGHWRFMFRGDEDTDGSVSRKDFVRVKR